MSWLSNFIFYRINYKYSVYRNKKKTEQIMHNVVNKFNIKKHQGITIYMQRTDFEIEKQSILSIIKCEQIRKHQYFWWY